MAGVSSEDPVSDRDESSEESVYAPVTRAYRAGEGPVSDASMVNVLAPPDS